MQSIDEQKEYEEFWHKLIQKAVEVKADFKKLSSSNQSRVRGEIENLIHLGSIDEVVKCIADRR